MPSSMQVIPAVGFVLLIAWFLWKNRPAAPPAPDAVPPKDDAPSAD